MHLLSETLQHLNSKICLHPLPESCLRIEGTKDEYPPSLFNWIFLLTIKLVEHLSLK